MRSFFAAGLAVFALAGGAWMPAEAFTGANSRAVGLSREDAGSSHLQLARAVAGHDATRQGHVGGATGLASFYGGRFHGRLTASGARFDLSAMTAAHRSLPFGTRVRVTHLGNGRTVDVRINDRGPYVGGRIIDLSRGAAGVLGMHGQGVARVKVTVLGR